MHMLVLFLYKAVYYTLLYNTMARKQKKKSTKRKNKKSNKNIKRSPIAKDQLETNSSLTELSEDTKESINKQIKDQTNEAIHVLMEQASQMWKVVKEHVKEHPEFMDIKDMEKLQYFRKEKNYDEFMDEFPVMTRYMICMGQYSGKAFKRFLSKLFNIRKQYMAETQEVKHDQWLRLQADYVQYLWEAYQKGHYNTAERKFVWQDAYKNLKGEFDDFQDKYKAIEKYTKEEKEKLKADNARDLIKRLSEGQQTLTEEQTKMLIYKLTDKVYKNKFNKVMNDIDANIKTTPAVTSQMGQGKEQNPNAPRIIMTEHVDEDKMDQIPQKYKI